VSRLGVPVVVTISYFPNWQVSGAEGVYRVSPNLMVVVPTSHHVSLSYGYTPVDFEGYALTLLALIGLLFLVRRPLAPVAAVRRPGLGQRLDVLGAVGGSPARPQGVWQPVGGTGTTPYWPVASSGAPWPGSHEEFPAPNGEVPAAPNGEVPAAPNGAATPNGAPTPDGDGPTSPPHWVASPDTGQWETYAAGTAATAPSGPSGPSFPTGHTGHTGHTVEPPPQD
jgi:hypothetical protein